MQLKVLDLLLIQCSKTLSDSEQYSWVNSKVHAAIVAMEQSLEKYQPYLQGKLLRLALFLDPHELQTAPMVVEMKDDVKEIL